jgi:hypothetical protein
VPDATVGPPEPGRYPEYVEARVAVLEQIARTTSTALDRIERRLDAILMDQRADFRWLLGIMLGGFGALLSVMAHGFHWL